MCNLESMEKECVCRTSSRSLELSLSAEDIVCDSGDVQSTATVEWDEEWSAKPSSLQLPSVMVKLADAAILRGYIICRGIVWREVNVGTAVCMYVR